MEAAATATCSLRLSSQLEVLWKTTEKSPRKKQTFASNTFGPNHPQLPPNPTWYGPVCQHLVGHWGINVRGSRPNQTKQRLHKHHEIVMNVLVNSAFDWQALSCDWGRCAAQLHRCTVGRLRLTCLLLNTLTWQCRRRILEQQQIYFSDISSICNTLVNLLLFFFYTTIQLCSQTYLDIFGSVSLLHTLDTISWCVGLHPLNIPFISHLLDLKLAHLQNAGVCYKTKHQSCGITVCPLHSCVE